MLYRYKTDCNQLTVLFYAHDIFIICLKNFSNLFVDFVCFTSHGNRQPVRHMISESLDKQYFSVSSPFRPEARELRVHRCAESYKYLLID